MRVKITKYPHTAQYKPAESLGADTKHPTEGFRERKPWFRVEEGGIIQPAVLSKCQKENVEAECCVCVKRLSQSPDVATSHFLTSKLPLLGFDY